MTEKLFSLKMRAARGGSHRQGGRHISGVERIISEAEINEQTEKLIKRARRHKQGAADYINITLECLNRDRIQRLTLLPITTIEVDDYLTGRKEVKRLLIELGVKNKVVDKAINLLTNGASPDGDNMRGAILMDVETGKRLEPDKHRGIRATRMDYAPEVRTELQDLLRENKLNTSHLPEALVLATKVVSQPQIIAELCWSDDPGYTAGYVASREFGYCRFPRLKPAGLNKGGRVFFLESSTDLDKLLTYLETRPVLISELDSRVKSYSTIKEIKK